MHAAIKGMGWVWLVASLSGCAANQPESAWQLMQQQEQALLQQRSDDAQRQRALASRPAVALSLIREAQQSGRHFAALAYLDAYRQAYGDSLDVQVMRADALRLTGQGEAAQALYRGLLNGEQAATAWHGLGLLAAANGDDAAALDALARAVQLRPTEAQYLGDLGYARLRIGDLAGARVPLGQAAELAPDNARILANLALLLVLSGEERAAQEIMARGQLSAAARSRVHQLAAELRQAWAQAPQVPLASTAPGVTARGSQVRAVATREPATARARVATQRPLLDHMTHSPLMP